MGSAQSRLLNASTGSGGVAGAGVTLYSVGISLTGAGAAVVVGVVAGTAARFVTKRLMASRNPRVTGVTVSFATGGAAIATFVASGPVGVLVASGMGSLMSVVSEWLSDLALESLWAYSFLGPMVVVGALVFPGYPEIVGNAMGFCLGYMTRTDLRRDFRLAMSTVLLSGLCILPQFAVGSAVTASCVVAAELCTFLPEDVRTMFSHVYQVAGVSMAALALTASPVVAGAAGVLWTVSLRTPDFVDSMRKLAGCVVLGAALPTSCIVTVGPFVGLAGVGLCWLYEWCAGFPGIHDAETLEELHLLMAAVVGGVQVCMISPSGWMWLPLVMPTTAAVCYVINKGPCIIADSIARDRREENAQTVEGALKVVEQRLRESGDYVEYQNRMNAVLATNVF